LLSAKKVAAGKSGRIEMKVDTASLSGIVEKSVFVTTNDPQNEIVKLTIKAEIEPEVILSDAAIFFGDSPRGKELRRELLMTVPRAKSIKIHSVRSTDPAVSVRIEGVDGSDGKNMRLIAVRKANAPIGPHFGKIIVRTLGGRVREIVIYESGNVTAGEK